MNRIAVLCDLTLALTLLPGVRRAEAQAMLADDIIILSKGQRNKEKAKPETHLGPMPGAGESLFRYRPGSIEARLGERSASSIPSPLGISMGSSTSASRAGGILSAASGYDAGAARIGPAQIPSPLPPPRPASPSYGALDLPGGEDEGPADGLTLDMAIDRLLHSNPDLGTKFREIPKAQADVLTAGLRANPLVFASADNVPYGNYSPQRPGNNGYSVVLIQPVDVNQKRKVRVHVAEQAKKVLEAQFQDAVRLAIDNVYTAFVDVLDARETLRFKRANLTRLNDVVKTVEEQASKGVQPESAVDEATIQRDTAEVELEGAAAALVDAKRVLVTLLHIPPAEANTLDVRGSARDEIAPPPPEDDLIRMALCVRPDVVSYRLGIHRARSDIRLAQAERIEDVFLLYTPYQFTNYAPEGQKSATGWSVGVLVSLPVFNRNQGNIARAKLSEVQSRIELNGLERQVVTEVQRAWQEYQTTRSAVQRLERSILPRARHLRDDKFRLYTEGQEDISVYYNAERGFNEVVRQYRDALIRHRRSMLRLNTAVGQRVLP
jgi:cobalt-zinc-cadmium efflux system outer membrane protein